MIGDGPVRAIGDFVSRFGVRRAQPAVVADVAAPVTGRGPVFPTKVLSRFLAPLRERAAPVVVDLGTALGPNVTFLGEQLGCKLFVEDLLAELGSAAEEDVDEPPERVARLRLAHADTSADGVLCWDVLEYLGSNAARLVAGEVKRVLRPGGVVFLCFGTDHRSGAVQTTYEIVDEGKLRYRCGDRARHKRRVLQSREMMKLFEPLTIVDSVLLTSRMREMVLRKSSKATGTDTPPRS